MNYAFEFPPTVPDDIHTRIADARRSGEMTDCARAVLDILAGANPRLGRASAVSIAAMQRKWTASGEHVWPERSVKGAAKELLECHELPIGSSRSSNNPGYFICETDADCESAVRPLIAEIRSLARRCNVLSPRSHYVRGLLGQLEIGGEQ